MNDGLFSPRVMECYRFISPPVPNGGARIVTDYEMDYNLGADRVMTLDGKEYVLERDCIVFRRPGQNVSSAGPFDIYALTLDFSHGRELPSDARHAAVAASPQRREDYWDAFPTVFKPQHAPEILRLYQNIAVNALRADESERLRGLVSALLHLVIADRYMEKEAQDAQPTLEERVISYFSRHYMEKITLDGLAERLNYNKSYLVRYFRQKTGVTPIRYLNRMRLRNARILLRHREYSVAEISYRCGFESPSYFIRLFREAYAETPDVYRRAACGGKAGRD